MTRSASVCFITVCKGRLAYLRESLPVAATQAPCIVVDYACPDGAAAWVEKHHPDVEVVRIQEGGPFNLAAGRNAGALAARTEWLCFLDADVIPTSDLVEAFSPLLRPGRYYRPFPETGDTWGTVICRRADFERVGGYDEAFEFWGGEDDDLYMRLRAIGLAQHGVPGHLLRAIQHGDELRTRFHAIGNREWSRRINVAYMMLKQDLRALTRRDLDLSVRRALFAEVRRVLSRSIPAAISAKLEVELPDASLLPDWTARRSLTYELPVPPSLEPPSASPAFASFRTAQRRSPLPFIVGTGRCGSTLLRLMLDSHPDLAIPDEAIFMPTLVRNALAGADLAELLRILESHHSWNSFGVDTHEMQVEARSIHDAPLAAVLRAFYHCYARRFSKTRYGDKTIANVRNLRLLADLLPEARFVHLVRDGRDVALSMRGLWFGVDTIAEAAAYWTNTISGIRNAVDPARLLELRYEDLVGSPEPTLRRLCDFIELTWDPRMVQHHLRASQRLAEIADGVAWNGARIPAARLRDAHALAFHPLTSSRIGCWRNALNSVEARQFALLAGPLLAELGYPPSQ